METVIVSNEAELKKCIREVIREELALLLADVRPPWQEFEEPLITRKEMAEHLNISLVTLAKWVRNGLPCIRKDGRVQFLKSEVMKAIKQKPTGDRGRLRIKKNGSVK
ncbi:MAG: helix-turn-helix domain-containing protein [Puia sp.]|nr:helix-turn-helix domain-containing protein [Puia sp.]